MSMSICVTGVVPADDEYKKKVAAWKACKAAGVPTPSELDKFFNYETPDELGMEMDLRRGECSKEYRNDYSEGYVVDVTKLPQGVRYIRLYISC